MILYFFIGVIFVLVATMALAAILPMWFMCPLPSGKIAGTDIIAIKNRSNNLFFIPSEGGWIAIDAGSDTKTIMKEMERMSIDRTKVRGIFLTHTDYDHTASVPLLPDAAIYMSKQEKQMIDGSTKRQLLKKNKLPEMSSPDKIIWMNDRETADIAGHTVQLIWAPGHTKGSAMYVVDGEYLFSGDAFRIANGEILLHPYTMDREQADKTIQNIKRELKKYKKVFTSHYGALSATGRNMV